MYFNEVWLQWAVFYPCCWGSLSTRDAPFSSGPACQDDWISFGPLLQESLLPALLMLKQMFKGGFLYLWDMKIRRICLRIWLHKRFVHQRCTSEMSRWDTGSWWTVNVLFSANMVFLWWTVDFINIYIAGSTPIFPPNGVLEEAGFPWTHFFFLLCVWFH